MPRSISDEALCIPDDFRPAFARLSDELDRQHLPPKLLDRNLLVAAWNVRHLISYHEDKEWLKAPRYPPPLPEEWRNPEQTSRDPFALHFIARIIARFDVVMLTEVRAGAEAVRAIHKILGPNWGVLIQDVSEARHGIERLVYFFDRRKVTPSGLVCEIVLPATKRVRQHGGMKRGGHRQFARPPYVAGFECGPFALTLVALHIKWWTHPDVRENELTSIAERLRSWQVQKDRWAPNLIALGDFQLYDEEHRGYEDNPMYKAFTSTKLYIPETLCNIRSVIFSNPSLSGGLAWFEDSLDLQALGAGNFDFVDVLEEIRFKDFDFSQIRVSQKEVSGFWHYIPDEALRRKAYAMGKYISDRLPLWVEFSVRERRYINNNG